MHLLNEKEEHRYLSVIIILSIGLVGFYFFGTYTGFVSYPREDFISFGPAADFFPSFGGLFEIYAKYAQWADFFLFLLIFLGLGHMAFGDRVRGGGRALYVGLGIFLALALVVWEVRTGTSLVVLLGPLVLVFLIILLFFMMFRYVRGRISFGGVALLSILYIIGYIIFTRPGAMAIYYGSWVYRVVPFDLVPLATLIFFFAVVAFLVGLAGFVLRRRA